MDRSKADEGDASTDPIIENPSAPAAVPALDASTPAAAMPPIQPLIDLSMPVAFNGETPLVPPPVASKLITPDEIALYDRQIRLWGMAAQAKIQSASVLLITLRALSNEIAKNLVLAGVGSLTILDDATTTPSDLSAHFLLAEADSDPGQPQNRAEAALPALRRLNPRVSITADPSGVRSKGPSYFSSFDVVIATDLDPDCLNLINTATRINSKPFYAAGTHGLYGFIFSDLIEHDFVIQRDVGNVATQLGRESRTRSVIDVQTRRDGPKTVEAVTKREVYSTWLLSDAATLPADLAKSRRRMRSVTPALSCFRALWSFMQQSAGRMPATKDDVRVFTQLATIKHRSLGLPSETLRPDFLRSFLQNLGCELAPTTAILGGQLAQDVINVLGQTQQPIQNMVLFDGNSMEAPMYALHPEGELGAALLSAAAPAPLISLPINPAALPLLQGLPAVAPNPLSPLIPKHQELSGPTDETPS